MARTRKGRAERPILSHLKEKLTRRRVILMDTITSMNMSTKTMATDMGTIIIPKRMKYWGWKYQ
jgi:hypothetical protein